MRTRDIVITSLVVGTLVIVARKRISHFLRRAIVKSPTKQEKYTGSESELDRLFKTAAQIVSQCDSLTNEQQLQFYSKKT